MRGSLRVPVHSNAMTVTITSLTSRHPLYPETGPDSNHPDIISLQCPDHYRVAFSLVQTTTDLPRKH
eukprot:1733511-Rhodomonas_salina.5